MRWASKLYMDGPGLIQLTLDTVPPMIERILAEGKVDAADVELYIVHQATLKLLDRLRDYMHVDENKLPTILRDYGNTVSSTIPIMLRDLRSSGRLRRGTRSLLCGFGVGFSWAGCLWTEVWENKAVATADLEAA
jgi:3-oxoacyl-[acyl-carrier-protein] synthase-3